MPAFVELLARSAFSFLRGASQPEEVVARAKELELEALALCDRDGLYGSVRAHAAALEVGQRVIVGAELGVDARAERRGSWQTAARAKAAPELPTLALLVENHEGYTNLCRLLTRAHAGMQKGESALDPAWLGDHARGLVAVVPSPRRPGDAETPPGELLSIVKEAFGERAALAVHRHFDPFDRERMMAARSWSHRYGLPLVASARPRFHDPLRKPLADVMHCIRTGTTLDRAGTALDGNAEAHLRSELEMRRLFAERPALVDRAGELAEGLRFSLAELRYRFPCTLEPDETADQMLRRLTLSGLSRRYPGGVPAKVSEQIEKELSLIASIDVAPYFLSTLEVVEIARRRRILCQGRGSAANSAVCYALGITAVDPVRSSLLFERFLSAERREPPDIDIDFEHERREEVIQELYERWGRDRAAMVSEVISYRGKSALREVGKVFGLSPEQVDRLSQTIIHWEGSEASPGRVAELGFDPEGHRVRQVLARARELEGFPRHLSIHVGGFVLSAAPLEEVTPVEPARMPDRTVLPWDKDDIDTLGFFKVDVLGLGMLTAIRKALALIHAGGGLRLPEGVVTAECAPPGSDEPFDPLDVVTRVPAEDPEVYAMVSRADTVGVFQIESRAQMAMLPRLQPRKFYDLVVEVAIVRPGPIQGGMVHPYLRRRSGAEPISCPHPSLEPILERTLGVPLFQEQVMQIAITGAGYSAGEADQLRRDMAAWRRNGRLLRHRDRLLAGFAARGIAQVFGEALFEQIKGFGEYGFPESHAASFALLVYLSSWQKAHYPAHFACALLNSQPMGFYSASTIVNDAKRHGVTVLDVDVTKSDWDSTLEPATPGANDTSATHPALRLGLRQVVSVREGTARRIMDMRPFVDLDDCLQKSRMQKGESDALAEAGAFESLVPGRRQALFSAHAPRVRGLFEYVRPNEARVELPPLKAAEQLMFDYRRKRLSVGDHPMRHLRADLAKRSVVSAAELLAAPHGKPVSVAGVVITRQQPGTAKGVVFITLEDETGFANLILFRHVFESELWVALHSTLLLAHGEVERAPRPSRETSDQGGIELDVVHLKVRKLERLDVPGRDIPHMSRDFR
ncbi:MAG TPA: error-prone DNA polymerase [Polyangiaceae bacterium]|nr:error-prone DNA polymerase [Polyangiaceae bacterium]